MKLIKLFSKNLGNRILIRLVLYKLFETLAIKFEYVNYLTIFI